ncbi:hypothetical protein HDU91_000186 [Kappamyces sp. JEL0680]|nr:hypothetical protein HDU91_000186 [Kappamyces sp. JEL0680]
MGIGESDIGGAPDRVLDLQDGVVLLKKFTAGCQDYPTIGHWKPHRNPLSHVSFNASQTIVFTCSTKGTTIYGWDLTNSFSNSDPNRLTAPPCIRKFARGFTSAIVTNLTPSPDDQWLSCSTLRGTTHLYKIEPTTSMQQVSLRINSRNSLQVMRSLFAAGTTPESLGSSPVHVKAPSSMDNATSDLGYDDVSLDMAKNVWSTCFLPSSVANVKSASGTSMQKRFPLLVWDPYGKLALVHTFMTAPEAAAASMTSWARSKFSATCVSEWNAARSSSWKETCNKRIREPAAKPNPQMTWPSKIEISTTGRLTPLWEAPYSTVYAVVRDGKGNVVEKTLVETPQQPKPYGHPHISNSLPSPVQYAIDSILPSGQGIESLTQTEEGYHLVLSSQNIPKDSEPSMLLTSWGKGKSLFSAAYSMLPNKKTSPKESLPASPPTIDAPTLILSGIETDEKADC